MDREVTFCWE